MLDGVGAKLKTFLEEDLGKLNTFLEEELGKGADTHLESEANGCYSCIILCRVNNL